MVDLMASKAMRWGGLALAVVAARELYLWAGPERVNEKSQYYLARNRANQLERPLVVLGGPKQGNILRRIFPASWGSGDVCIGTDGEPCRDCVRMKEPDKGCKLVSAVNPVAYLQEVPEDSVVIYDATGIENASNPEALVTAMYRAAGDSRNIFVPQIHKRSWTSQRLTALVQTKRWNSEQMQRFDRSKWVGVSGYLA